VGKRNDNAYRFYVRNGFASMPEMDRPGEYALVKTIREE
jgi:hypothetical protein